jgi:hypothetical protein
MKKIFALSFPAISALKFFSRPVSNFARAGKFRRADIVRRIRTPRLPLRDGCILIGL